MKIALAFIAISKQLLTFNLCLKYLSEYRDKLSEHNNIIYKFKICLFLSNK